MNFYYYVEQQYRFGFRKSSGKQQKNTEEKNTTAQTVPIAQRNTKQQGTSCCTISTANGRRIQTLQFRPLAHGHKLILYRTNRIPYQIYTCTSCLTYSTPTVNDIIGNCCSTLAANGFLLKIYIKLDIYQMYEMKFMMQDNAILCTRRRFSRRQGDIEGVRKRKKHICIFIEKLLILTFFKEVLASSIRG